MKKIIAFIIALALILSMAAFAEVQEVSEIGMKIDIPDDYMDRNITFSTISEDGAVGLITSFINYEAMTPAMDAYKEAMLENDETALMQAQTDYMEQYMQHVATYYILIGLETERLDELRATYGITDENSSVIGANSTHTYYRLDETEIANLSEADITLMEENRPVAEAVASSMEIIEVTESEEASGEDIVSNLQAFSTVDMEGNTVTEDIFAKADLTVLNIWGTYCSPCINEMPELAEWANELPENVQLVGLIVDVASDTDKTYEKAVKILSKSGVTFTNLLYNDTLKSVIGDIAGTPTTLFIDRNGNSVHELVLGADMDAYKAAVEEILAR